MPVVPNLLERALFLGLNLAPGFIVDIAAAAALRAAGAAERLGLFAALADGLEDPATIGARIGADAGSVALLCAFLARTGYLDRSGPRYRLSKLTRRWLLRSSKTNQADFAALWEKVVSSHWNGLDEAVRSGRPAPHLHEWLDREGAWPTFNSAMAQLASTTADAVSRAVALPAGSRRLLDLGGSHALNAIAFCRRRPELTAVIVDLPQGLERARDAIAAAGMTERVTTRAADLTHDELGADFDVTLLFQLLHYFTPVHSAPLLGRVAAALKPGGRVVILDQLAGGAPTPTADAFLALLALNYKIGLAGHLYSFAELDGLLRGAGFRDVRRHALRAAPGNWIVEATR